MQTKNLKEILKTLTSVIKLDKTRPITSLVSVATDGGTLYLGATDLQTSVFARIDCETQIDPTTVSMTDLYALLKSFKGKEVTIKQDKGCLMVECDGKYRLPYKLDIDDEVVKLPINVKKIDDLVWVEGFDEAYKQLKVGIDLDVLPIVRFEDNIAITTDGNILVMKYFEFMDTKITIPSKVAEQFAAIGKVADVGTTKNSLYAKNNTYALYSSWGAVDEMPMDEIQKYKAIDCPLKVDKDKFLDIVRRLKALKKKQLVIIHKDLKLFIHDIDMTVKEELDYEIERGNRVEDVTIIFNTDELLKVLRVIDEDMCIELNPKYISLKDWDCEFIISGVTE